MSLQVVGIQELDVIRQGLESSGNAGTLPPTLEGYIRELDFMRQGPESHLQELDFM